MIRSEVGVVLRIFHLRPDCARDVSIFWFGASLSNKTLCHHLKLFGFSCAIASFFSDQVFLSRIPALSDDEYCCELPGIAFIHQSDSDAIIVHKIIHCDYSTEKDEKMK